MARDLAALLFCQRERFSLADSFQGHCNYELDIPLWPRDGSDDLVPQMSQQCQRGRFPLYTCPSSQLCWDWCASILSLASRSSPRHRLTAGQVLVAAPLSEALQIPPRLWQVSHATICWQLWKARNDCSFNATPMDSEVVIRKSWHGI